MKTEDFIKMLEKLLAEDLIKRAKENDGILNWNGLIVIPENKETFIDDIGSVVESTIEAIQKMSQGKLQDRFAIKDLSEGRCALKHDGTTEELNEVLRNAFPKFQELAGNFQFYFKHPINPLCVDFSYSTKLPTQSTKVFLEELRAKKDQWDGVLFARDVTTGKVHEIIRVTKGFVFVKEGLNNALSIDKNCCVPSDKHAFDLQKKLNAPKDPWEGVEFASYVASGGIFEIEAIIGGLIVLKNGGTGSKFFFKPSTEEEYVGYLKKQLKEKFGIIQIGDIFDLSVFRMRRDAKVTMANPEGVPNFKYRKDEDMLIVGGVMIYWKGQWATKVNPQIETGFINRGTTLWPICRVSRVEDDKIWYFNPEGKEVYNHSNVLKSATVFEYLDQLKIELSNRFGKIEEGDKFQSIDFATNIIIAKFFENRPEFQYLEDYDQFFVGNVEVYKKGKWATRISKAEEKIKESLK